MKQRVGRMGLVALSVLAACGIVLSQAQAQGRTSPLGAGLGKEFASKTATVNGIKMGARSLRPFAGSEERVVTTSSGWWSSARCGRVVPFPRIIASRARTAPSFSPPM
jgi:hypothetical protein